MNAIRKFEGFYSDLASMQVDKLANLYSSDVVFIDPITAHSGIEEVEKYFGRLLQTTKHCSFTINSIRETKALITLANENEIVPVENSEHYSVTWQMTFASPSINRGKDILVDGITQLKIEDDKIIFHRDYYDLGQMIYENVTLLGRIVKRIKKNLR